MIESFLIVLATISQGFGASSFTDKEILLFSVSISLMMAVMIYHLLCVLISTHYFFRPRNSVLCTNPWVHLFLVLQKFRKL